MRLGTAIERLFDNYVYASNKEWIHDKVAWAFYHTWKEIDDRKDEPQMIICPIQDGYEALIEYEPQTDCSWK